MSYDTVWQGPAWEDLRSPATGINPPGLASDPVFDSDECALRFTNTVDNVLAIIQHTPHSWAKPTPWKPHIHVYARVAPGAAQTVNWRLEYKLYESGDVVPEAWQTINVVQTITPDDYNTSARVTFGEIDLSAITGLGGFVKAKLSRIVAGQTYNSPVFLDEFDFHIQRDSAGSPSEHAK